MVTIFALVLLPTLRLSAAVQVNLRKFTSEQRIHFLQTEKNAFIQHINRCKDAVPLDKDSLSLLAHPAALTQMRKQGFLFCHFVYPHHPHSAHRSLPEVQGLDLSSERKESNVVLEAGQQTRIPACQEYQVHKLG